MQWEEMIIMDRKEVIEKFQKPERENHWEEEQSLDLITPQQATLHVSRIKYIGENAEKDNEKRCLSITKNGKSVAFDIEMAYAVAAALQELGDKYVPEGLK